jgi:release factor glutamine methyltransferase
MTVKEASKLIFQGLTNGYPPSEIESFIFLIFNHLLNFKWGETFLRANETVPDQIMAQIYDIIEQLKQNRPIQYVLGTTEFYGLPFLVDESVLIPRPETEELVQWIITDYKDTSPKIIDIGTGSGCIAIALGKNLFQSRVVGVDISDTALETAKRNGLINDLHIEFLKADILSDHMQDLGIFDIIVSNPPYVTRSEMKVMEANVIEYEPHNALFVPDDDPLVFYKAIGRFASVHLKKTGALYLEINEFLPDETSRVLEDLGFAVECRRDLNTKIRMLKVKFK